MKNRVKELRLSKKLTQQELADKLHTTKANICMIENNKRNLTASSLVDFANFFEVSTDYLLGKTDNPNLQTMTVVDADGSITEVQHELLDATKGLTIEDMQEIFNYVDYLKSKKGDK